MKTQLLDFMYAEAKRAHRLAKEQRYADAYANIFAIARYAEGARLSPLVREEQYGMVARVYAILQADFGNVADPDIRSMAAQASGNVLSILRS